MMGEILDFGPVRVAGHRVEEVGHSIVAYQSHGVFVDSVHAVVIVRLELLLVVLDPLDAVAFDADECVDAVLLEQLLTKVEWVERHSSRHGYHPG
uniref:Uncharacterized protein n=1 Tax=Acrobeloides nanus TaxID=290746 RepID=A0A914CPQ4_9BILA